ncbi:TIGR03560 family F420-dependent LLM class oxidoreductase [Luteimicrobium subarcticum]|nr:TIGR03560 family F420-dependent LLM class oxidoreductase [Luteimicrobium subarcticum]
MRFGLFVPQGWRQDLTGIDPADQWEVMRSIARHADTAFAGEGLPGAAHAWESIWVYDHFHTVPEPVHEATHEAWSLVNAFAASTDRVRLGQMCTCMAYRNPAYLAKVATTADIVSGGRVEMGIGAGWYEHEWRAYGYGFPSAGERLKALEEGVDIMAQMWRTGAATLDGSVYQVDGALCYPQPLQHAAGDDTGPSIPLWIAGGGEKKTLRIAAQWAQYTNFGGDAETFKHKSEVLARHCTDLGRDFGTITRSGNFNVVIGETQADVEDRLRWVGEHYRKTVSEDAAEREVADLRGAPLTGTVEQVSERIAELRGLGLEYLIAYFPGIAYDRSGVELFEREVVPAFL